MHLNFEIARATISRVLATPTVIIKKHLNFKQKLRILARVYTSLSVHDEYKYCLINQMGLSS